jgi:hypothetical protein
MSLGAKATLTSTSRRESSSIAKVVSHQTDRRRDFARDLQERLGILALLALSAPFRFCNLQILLAKRETDPVSGHHFQINNLGERRALLDVFRRY